MKTPKRKPRAAPKPLTDPKVQELLRGRALAEVEKRLATAGVRLSYPVQHAAIAARVFDAEHFFEPLHAIHAHRREAKTRMVSTMLANIARRLTT